MGEASEVVIPIFGILDVTGEVIAMWAIILVLTVLSLIVTRSLRQRPGRLQNIIEAGVEYLENFFSGIIGRHHADKYFWFLGSLFVFIIVSNFSGLIPGMGMTKFCKAPTSSLSVTLGLGVASFLFLQTSGLRAGPKRYIKRFVSPIVFMLPLLMLDEIIKPASLALRLFGNIFGEETLTEQIYGLIPIGVPMVMMLLSVLFCTIQAIVFTMLVSIYLEETLE